MRLANKVAIITGGGTGIGRATAILFSREGAKVVITGRRREPLEETMGVITSENGVGFYSQCDVSKKDEFQVTLDRTIKEYGKIDILVNNAAVFVGNGKTIIDLSEEEWDTLMAVNLKGVFLCSKAVIPYMINNGKGVIVNCSSISGHIGQPKQGAYNAAKGGVELLSKCMALDLAAHNIRVNTVCPGWVEIDANREDIRVRREEILRLHPIGRVGQPEDIAPAFLYLASDESAWVTGTSLMIDGGYTAQ
jgi:NAD(P)-dependent dehydrogenase (short-subunit alcohol dehydrogenase family)